MKELLTTTEKKMQKALESLAHSFAKIRTGRASPSVIEDVMVSYYGSATALKQIASISIEDARTLSVSPWEKNLIPEIEKAIHSSGLGFNPITTGDVIRIPMPEPTEESRKEYVKHAKSEAESARVAIRNARRDANQQVKELSESEDEEHGFNDDVQKLTNKYISKVDESLQEKETSLLTV